MQLYARRSYIRSILMHFRAPHPQAHCTGGRDLHYTLPPFYLLLTIATLMYPHVPLQLVRPGEPLVAVGVCACEGPFASIWTTTQSAKPCLEPSVMRLTSTNMLGQVGRFDKAPARRISSEGWQKRQAWTYLLQ